MKLASSLVLAASLVACSSSSPTVSAGTSTVTGTVAGIAVPDVSAIVFTGPAVSGTSCPSGADGGDSSCSTVLSGQTMILSITNRSDLSCSAVQSSGRFDIYGSNLHMLQLELSNATNALVPKTYSATDSFSSASFYTLSATCGPDVAENASGGSITISAIDTQHVAGSYSVTFTGGDAVQGTFDLPFCTVPDGALKGDGGTPACRP